MSALVGARSGLSCPLSHPRCRKYLCGHHLEAYDSVRLEAIGPEWAHCGARTGVPSVLSDTVGGA